jgi:pimeloyl-ACP methyl ester carboxylesterase
MTLVFLGGLGTTRAMWEPQLAAFPDAVALDLPRLDTVEAIAGHVLEQVPGRFAFCGLSLGGMVGMWLGANAPERVERLVLACTGPKLGTKEDYVARAELVRREGTDAVVDGARERWFTPDFRDDPRARRILDDLRGIDPETYAACAEAVGDFDFRDDVERIAVPTLVVYGRDDPVTPERPLPGVEIPGAHLASVESPDEFNHQLRSFL